MKSKVIFFIMSVFLIYSCEKKDEIPDRDKFLGTYSVVESCGEGNDTYEIRIDKSSQGENAILIFNLWNWEENFNAIVSGNNVNIPVQISDGVTFSGTGSISGNNLTITFSVTELDWNDNCSTTCTKK